MCSYSLHKIIAALGQSGIPYKITEVVMHLDSPQSEESPSENPAAKFATGNFPLADECKNEGYCNLLARVAAKNENSKILRVVVLDNHELFREGMLRLLVMEGEFAPVTGPFAGARHLVQHFWPDLVLLGLGPAKERCIQHAKSLRQEFPQFRMLLLDEMVRTPHVRETLAIGAEGYWTKHANFSKIVTAIQLVASGGQSFCPEVEKHLQRTDEGLRFDPPHERRAIARLTPQESELFLLLAQGYSIARSAEQLKLSKDTAEKRRSRILRKLQVQELADLTRIAIREGLLT
jgi:DNA-binding NarL/FixJ family response regulator